MAKQHRKITNDVSPPSLLTDDILCQIFRLLPLRDLSNAPLVCRRWESILLEHESIWWDAIYLDNDLACERKDFCAFETFKLASKLLERSNGTAKKVFLPISIDYCNLTEISCAMENVIKARVKCLWILIGRRLKCCKACKSFKKRIDVKEVSGIASYVVETVKRCSDLTSLRLVTTLKLKVQLTKPEDSGSHPPITCCKLEHLCLVQIPLDLFFREASIFHAFRTLCSLRISQWSYLDRDQHLELMAILRRILSVAQITLQDVRFDFQFFNHQKYPECLSIESPTTYLPEDQLPDKVTLPKLETLTMYHNWGSNWLLFLHTPNLVRLNLSLEQNYDPIKFHGWISQHPLQKLSFRCTYSEVKPSFSTFKEILPVFEEKLPIKNLVVWETVKRNEYHKLDSLRFRLDSSLLTRLDVVKFMQQYVRRQVENGVPRIADKVQLFDHILFSKEVCSHLASTSEIEVDVNKLSYERTFLHMYEKGMVLNHYTRVDTIMEYLLI